VKTRIFDEDSGGYYEPSSEGLEDYDDWKTTEPDDRDVRYFHSQEHLSKHLARTMPNRFRACAGGESPEQIRAWLAGQREETAMVRYALQLLAEKEPRT